MRILFLIGVALTPSMALSQVVKSNAVVWMAAPPVFPAGARMAVMAGDPFKPGLFIVRLKMPAGYRVPPHHHPSDELVTVIAGEFGLGMGDRFDKTKGSVIHPGDFARAAVGMNHFAWAVSDAVVEIAALGPFGMTYVNASDDPRR